MATRKKRAAPARTRKPRSPARVRKRAKRQRGHHRPELWGLGLVAVGLVLATVLWLGWDGGRVGAHLSDWLRSALGSAAPLVPLALLGIGGLMLVRSALVDLRPFRTGIAVGLVGLMVTLGEEHGGAVGGALGGGLARVLGGGGALIVGVALLLAGVLLVTGASAGAVLRRSGHAVRQAGSAARRSIESIEWADWSDSESSADQLPALGQPTGRPGPVPIDGMEAFPDVVASGPLSSGPPPLLHPEPDEDEPTTDDGALVFDAPASAVEYRLPDRSLLKPSPPSRADSADVSARTAQVLVQTLAHFGVEATVVGTIAGPRVVRYELQLAPGTKVSKVAGLKDDLSYALATTEIRILAPIPGKQAVGVEVPNLAPRMVTLGDIFEDLPGSASPLSVWLGKDISGNAVWTDLARMPHLLIAGTTGSGKSGCINTLLTSILLRATPDDVRMILIDPKRIELNFYESIPHLLTPVVSSPKEASAVLHNVVAEMERRYERLSIVRARNLPEANRAFRARGEDPLPYLLVVIDELADLMMISPQAVEDAIIRLAQKSRAVGIHLVLATQRPSVDVITGMIKANVPSRIAFAVSSQTDSRVILDGAGAESLLGQGDMLFKPLGTSRLQRVQGAFVTEEEIALIVEQARAQRGQELDETLLAMPEGATPDDGDGDLDFDPDEDPLLDRAIEIVVQTQTASVSLLQRRLRVGYTRAGRLIDMLERRAIISGYEGSKPRRVLLEEHQLTSVPGSVPVAD
ncbi:MAG TPA: DNA translocase FtsK 4TM domain-containing protein [Gaiella sp.]|uniref:FtsK/SpoIIIE family DNA translocase n=1 Tax=Gaiella sp. TaxID=2663207 RepID=UPI002D806C91|nr:DNA translocase FtsK 4TM domain-containing protein [Gaiella sp.]HET9287985.1 DNA translocase FtsK 4TM domain-containing protein [Gaiella sp.]